MKRNLWYTAGAVCLFFAMIPALLYWIVNTGVIALGLAGVIFMLYARLGDRLSPKIRHTFYVLCVVVLLACSTLSGLMARHAWMNPPPASGTDAVIVLGSKVNGNRPSRMLARRLDVAAKYLAENPETVCVVSGGQGPDELYPEAHIMADYLIELGISPSRILIEDQSTNTQQNLEFSCKLLRENGYRVEHITIATDGFHQMRSAILAQKGSIEVSALSSNSPWGLLPSYWVREWPAICKAWLFDSGA